MYKKYNPNPDSISVGDCVVRAISAVERRRWEPVYIDICLTGLNMSDMPTANRVWGTYLMQHGFKRAELPDACPVCYTVRDFCRDHPYGEYILATGTHVIAAIDGDYYDAWDSGNEVPTYFWRRS